MEIIKKSKVQSNEIAQYFSENVEITEFVEWIGHSIQPLIKALRNRDLNQEEGDRIEAAANYLGLLNILLIPELIEVGEKEEFITESISNNVNILFNHGFGDIRQILSTIGKAFLSVSETIYFGDQETKLYLNVLSHMLIMSLDFNTYVSYVDEEQEEEANVKLAA